MKTLSMLVVFVLAGCTNYPPDACHAGHLVRVYADDKGKPYYVAYKDNDGDPIACEQ